MSGAATAISVLYSSVVVSLMFVDKFQTDVVKDWAKELYSVRSQTCSQHVNSVSSEDTS